MTFYMDVTARHNGMNMGERGPTPAAALAGDAKWARRVIDATQCPECRSPAGKPCREGDQASSDVWVHPSRVLRYDNQNRS